MFGRENILACPDIVALSKKFIETAASDDGSHIFFLVLDSYVGSLEPYAHTLLKAAERFSTTLAESSRNATTHSFSAAMDLAKLMLRLYQQLQDSGNKDLQEKCLDAWDNMIRSRVGGFYGVLKEIDA